MKIGIDGSRAFLRQRTGIEEYSYQIIKHLADKLKDHEVVLFVRNNQQIDFALPENWKVKIIKFPRFWTQLGLSLEMLLHPVDALFVPAHTVPFVHPTNTIVTIHGLEYEVLPQAYSFWERVYMRFSIRNSCRWATSIVSVSQNTKQDLMRLYGVAAEKINIVYEGYSSDENFQFPISPSRLVETTTRRSEADNFQINSKDQISNFKKYSPYLLFIGRIEERKNIIGIIKAFEILKEEYSIEHKLVLAGRGGYGFGNIEEAIKNSKYVADIVQLGFVPDVQKFQLISQADIFLFPTFYEGFGIPILEAQSVGVPVITSNLSSMPEVAGESAILVDPQAPDEIATGVQTLLSNKSLRDAIIEKGYINIERFSWDECAQKVATRLVA